MRIGEKAEETVKKHFEEEGYVVLNVNDKHFPDLIAFKDGKIAFFVEVKEYQTDKKPYVPYWRGKFYESLKDKLGVETKCINVTKDGKLEPYT
jgi:hypothetical protein